MILYHSFLYRGGIVRVVAKIEWNEKELFSRVGFVLTKNWSFNTDDAYITLRYSKHLSQGHGIVWNIGENPPVEGYSNFSFVLIGALALKLGINPILMLKVFSIISLIITCIMIYFLSRIWLDPLLSLIPIIILTSYRGTILWTVSGLETAVYQSFVVGSITFFVYGFNYTSIDSVAMPSKTIRNRSAADPLQAGYNGKKQRLGFQV